MANLRTALIGLTWAGVGLSGCGHADKQKAEQKPAIERSAERGPIRLKVTLDKDRVDVAEPVKMIVEARAPEGYEVKLPAIEDESGAIRVRSARELPNVATGAERQWREEYELESFVSGDQKVPPVSIHYRGPKETNGAAGGRVPAASQAASAPASEMVEGDLAVEPFSIHVVSALNGNADPTKLADLRDIKGAVEIPLARSRHWMAWVGGILLVFAIGSGILLYVLWRRRRERVEPPIEPGTWAVLEFRRLEGDRLIERGLYHEFYFRLSDIVRQYIERRFALMAPERTTDEFLHEVRRSPALGEEHQRLLRDFLESSDQVKFALYSPTRDEAENAFAGARNFVDETAYTPAVQSAEDLNRTDAEAVESVG